MQAINKEKEWFLAILFRTSFKEREIPIDVVNSDAKQWIEMHNGAFTHSTFLFSHYLDNPDETMINWSVHDNWVC